MLTFKWGYSINVKEYAGVTLASFITRNKKALMYDVDYSKYLEEKKESSLHVHFG